MEPLDRSSARQVTGELEGALQMAIMAIAPHQLATLETPGDDSFRQWLGGSFLNLLGPHAFRVAAHAGKGQVREILAIDRQLGEVDGFCGQPWQRSVAAGAVILEARSGLRSCPVLSRMAAAVASAAAPGHHATVFAAQAAVLHLSTQAILVALVFDEWRRANGCAGVVGFRRLLPEVTFVAARIYAGDERQGLRIA
jgi:hypothetical protein